VGLGRGVCRTNTAGMTDSGDAVITSASGTNSATTEPQPSATDALPIASDCASTENLTAAAINRCSTGSGVRRKPVSSSAGQIVVTPGGDDLAEQGESNGE
jgi:hypothetical protein